MSFIRTLLAAWLVVLAPELAADSPLVFGQAWVRALPPTQPNTAAYLNIENRGAAAVAIVSASSPVADRVEIHTTRDVDGYMRMEQLATLEIAAGQTLELAPGGIHLMLLGLAAMPAPGDSVRLCFTLATGAELCLDAPVRRDAGEETHQHHHH